MVTAAWPEGACWARIEARFACAGCGQLSPVNHLDVDGTATCAHCGLDQPLDPRAWARPLAFAHEVVDLSGVAPWVAASEALRGQRNPHAQVGLTIPAREWTESGAIAGRERLWVRVAPGYPVCARCRAPLALAFEGARTRSQCLHCSDVTVYELPVAAASVYAPARAVLAAEHRADRARAAVQTEVGGAAQLRCPACSAPLAPADHEARCTYCQTTSIVSSRLWHRLGVAAPRPSAWWVLFAGACGRRASLAATREADDIQAAIRASAIAAMQKRRD